MNRRRHEKFEVAAHVLNVGTPQPPAQDPLHLPPETRVCILLDRT